VQERKKPIEVVLAASFVKNSTAPMAEVMPGRVGIGSVSAGIAEARLIG
jgi:hypothetical protein